MVTKPLEMPLKAMNFKTDVHPDWCPGCGDFGIINGIQQSLAEMKLPPWETYLFSGVGCSGKTPHYIKVYGAHTLHGRVLPFALGAKIANPKLTVIAAGGDGDGYGIGVGHFVHAGRRNIDLTYVVFDNEVYGLTKGQASPTLQKGAQPKSLALPNINAALNPMALALSCGYTFIARTYAFDAKHMKATIQAAVQHRGMALVDVLQPCPTYNDLHTKDYFSGTVEIEGKTMPRTYYLDQEGYDGLVKNPLDIHEVNEKRQQAFIKAHQIEERVPLGIYYQIQLPTYEDNLKNNMPLLQQYAPVDIPYYDAQGNPTTDLSSAMADFVM
jgi:2-oxoglutarate/2-oxoacid ferredoxin oxidoreductase subunit beta